MATYLSRTPSGAGNRKKFTISMWIKRGDLGVDHWLVQAGTSGTEFDIRFNTSDQIRFSEYASSTGYGLITNRKFRDTSAWYHLVFTYDSAQATDTDRNKIYVNGEQISASDCAAYDSGKHPPQDHDNAAWNNTTEFRINDVTWTTSSAKDASYTHIHHTDGYAYAASDFGETNSTSGIWTPKTAPSVTYGTNGFFLKFENSGNLDLDSSGNNLTFTTSGTLTQNVDTPSNNFATFNPLWRARVNTVDVGTYLSNGNLTFNSTGGDSRLIYFASTIGVTSGKYYWEVKSYDGTGGAVGVCYNSMQSNTNSQFWDNSNLLGLAIKINGNNLNGKSGDGGGSLGVTYSAGDIYGFALDMDNYAVYAHINGTYVNSGSPTSGASKTGSLLNLLTSGTAYLNSGEPVFPFFADLSTNSHAGLQANFGNGFFGSTAISSEGTNASGIGKFEYDVPTGYTALSTKGLNE